jgi:hypothetical protein
MLKIIRNPEFNAPVKVLVPTDGGQREQQFTVRFRALTRSEEMGFDPLNATSTEDFLRRIVVGWEDLKDEDGSAFEFSDEHLNVLIDLHYIRFALVQTYTSQISGVRAARRGN